MNDFSQLMTALKRTPYHQWMAHEGLPVVIGHGVEDVRELPLSPWRRTGGKGSFIHLYGMEGSSGMYVGEIPPGGALHPEKHMYEEVIVILEGNGADRGLAGGRQEAHFRVESLESVRSAAQQLASARQWRTRAGEVFRGDHGADRHGPVPQR